MNSDPIDPQIPVKIVKLPEAEEGLWILSWRLANPRALYAGLMTLFEKARGDHHRKWSGFRISRG